MQTIGKIDSSADISLYFHIPFCTRKCDYCHFYVIPDQEIHKEQLLNGLKQEWERWAPFLHNKRIVSIYFGGGTPSLFGPARISEVLSWVRSTLSFEANLEITLEANPENINLILMQEYAKAGINRVSIGIQTLDDSLLKLLGRSHDAKSALKAVHNTYEAGINNISVDLMYDLPQQTLAHWEYTLQNVRQLPINHLSLYNLTIEPHTLFFKKQEILRKFLPSEETSLAMYEKAIELLEEVGLQQYEISAFARPGYHSKHNVGYWTARSFLGLGPSAFSYWEGKRFRNVANLSHYCKTLQSNQSPIDFSEELNLQARIRELLVIQLRLKSGVYLEEFQTRHGVLETSNWNILNQLIQEGFLKQEGDLIFLTKKGILFYDTVAAELI